MTEENGITSTMPKSKVEEVPCLGKVFDVLLIVLPIKPLYEEETGDYLHNIKCLACIKGVDGHQRCRYTVNEEGEMVIVKHFDSRCKPYKIELIRRGKEPVNRFLVWLSKVLRISK